MVLLVRYGELSLKSPYVRRQLEDRLVANVQAMFAASGVECVVRRERGRLFVHAEDEATALRLLRRVFGIVSISPAKETTSDLDSLTAFVVDYARGLLTSGKTFAIRPRRSGQHPYTSQELARVLGRAVQEAIPGLAVDLDRPDVELGVEVRGPKAYVFHETAEGPGGLPVGTQGRVAAAVDTRDGMVAAWLLMRRGCHIVAAEDSGFVEALRRWDPGVEVGGGRRDVLGVVRAATAASVRTETIALDPLVGLSEDDVRSLAARIEGT
ncbi:MAG: THUMP domain-containing protein [Candidatus Thermoplasmatota archaeon]|mgnify:FL=1